MALKPGWLKRQFNHVVEDVVQWPEWMRKEAGFTHEVKSSEYALRIAPKPEAQRYKIVAGIITASVRMGWRMGYEPGTALQLCCPFEVWCVMATIEARRYCLLREISDEELRAAGYSTHFNLLAFMHTITGYEEAHYDSEVTVIRWKNAHGKLVDEYKNSSASTQNFPHGHPFSTGDLTALV